MAIISFRRWSWKVLLTTLVVLFVQGVVAWGTKSQHQKVLLSEIDTITVYADRNTEYRRTKPFPQLSCVGGDAQKYGYRVEAMQCKNMGGSYGAEDIQWTCTAEVPDEFKLGRTEVVCEGFTSPDDPYVLKGSCAVEYTLHLTPKGRELYHSKKYKNPFESFPSSTIPKLSLWDRLFGPSTTVYPPTPTQPTLWESFSSSFFLCNFFRTVKSLITSTFSYIFANPLLMLLSMYLNYRLIRFILLTIYRFFFPATAPRTQRRPPFWSSFFGGGGGDPPGPPPPYTRHPPGSGSRKTYQVPPENQGWQPGFWSGLMGGAAAGYGLGSRNRQPPPQTTTRTYVEPEPQRGWFGGGVQQPQQQPQGSSWFGGPNSSGGSTMAGPRTRQRDREGMETGSGTHTSTGFGGTRRR